MALAEAQNDDHSAMPEPMVGKALQDNSHLSTQIASIHSREAHIHESGSRGHTEMAIIPAQRWRRQTTRIRGDPCLIRAGSPGREGGAPISTHHARTAVTLDHDANSKPVLRFERHLGHRVARVWQALTTEDELAVWYPTGVRIEPVTGGTITFAFPGGEPIAGRVLEAARPTLLIFTTLDDVLRWELQAADDGCLLVLRNTVADPPHTPYTAAGFHIALNQLATLLDEGATSVRRTEMPPPDELVGHYRRALNLTD